MTSQPFQFNQQAAGAVVPVATTQTPPQAQTPVRYEEQPPQAQPAQPAGGGLDDAKLYDGFSTPLFPHVEGRWALKVTGMSGGVGHQAGPQVHTTFEVAASTTPNEVPVGSSFRIAYRYDSRTDTKAAGDIGTVHAQLMGRLISAVCGREPTDPTFSKVEGRKALFANDWATKPAMVSLQGTLRECNVRNPQTGQSERGLRRNDTWSIYQAPAQAATE